MSDTVAPRELECFGTEKMDFLQCSSPEAVCKGGDGCLRDPLLGNYTRLNWSGNDGKPNKTSPFLMHKAVSLFTTSYNYGGVIIKNNDASSFLARIQDTYPDDKREEWFNEPGDFAPTRSYCRHSRLLHGEKDITWCYPELFLLLDQSHEDYEKCKDMIPVLAIVTTEKDGSKKTTPEQTSPTFRITDQVDVSSFFIGLTGTVVPPMWRNSTGLVLDIVGPELLIKEAESAPPLATEYDPDQTAVAATPGPGPGPAVPEIFLQFYTSLPMLTEHWDQRSVDTCFLYKLRVI
ncbi:hypothetical protein TWF281_005286 [Arthrobotrys megalospora]